MSNLTNLNEFLFDFFCQFNFQSFLALITGIILGFTIFGAMYVVALVVSIRNDKKFKITLKNQIQIDDAEIITIVNGIKKTYQDDTVGLKTNDKFRVVREMSWEMIHQIAEKFYPESDYPIYELTLDEFMMLNHYITDRLDSVFDKRFFKPFRGMRVSRIIKFFEVKKKIDENKLMKAANKLHVPKLTKAAFAVLNAVNPAYWFKKLVIETTYNSAINKITLTIFDIVAEETHKVYSKSIFDKEAILRLENEYLGEEEDLDELEE